MGYIQRLPFILTSSVTIIIGLVCYVSGASTRDTFIKMIISLTVFYIIGLIVRNLILEIKKQVDEKIEQEKLESQKKAEEELGKSESTTDNETDKLTDSKFNKKANDADEFTPLNASKVIKNAYLKTE
ncbi:MAG TPA: hypothetical protein GXX36_05765 [Clostridiaceae bacterium]|nr:hypothetical protein [Clostridiaceae bacterium]HHV99066.1 hypothetical protein [Clostridiaceae bacterium]